MKSSMLMCAVAVTLFSLTAWAVPPQRLPSFTDGAVGELFLECGDFDILRDWEWQLDQVLYFNSDGSLKKWFFKYRPIYDILYNADYPSYWLASNSDPQQRWYQYSKSGELVGAAASNNFTVTAPGYGVVLQLHQRLTFDFVTGEIFIKGPDDFSAMNFDAICAALRAN